MRIRRCCHRLVLTFLAVVLVTSACSGGGERGREQAATESSVASVVTTTTSVTTTTRDRDLGGSLDGEEVASVLLSTADVPDGYRDVGAFDLVERPNYCDRLPGIDLERVWDLSSGFAADLTEGPFLASSVESFETAGDAESYMSALRDAAGTCYGPYQATDANGSTVVREARLTSVAFVGDDVVGVRVTGAEDPWTEAVVASVRLGAVIVHVGHASRGVVDEELVDQSVMLLLDRLETLFGG